MCIAINKKSKLADVLNNFLLYQTRGHLIFNIFRTAYMFSIPMRDGVLWQLLQHLISGFLCMLGPWTAALANTSAGFQTNKLTASCSFKNIELITLSQKGFYYFNCLIFVTGNVAQRI